jgi:hypothetical protein
VFCDEWHSESPFYFHNSVRHARQKVLKFNKPDTDAIAAAATQTRAALCTVNLK